MNPQNWTKTKPTTPGRYWIKNSENMEPTPVIVRKSGKGMSVFCLETGDRVAMNDLLSDVEWAKDEKGTP